MKLPPVLKLGIINIGLIILLGLSSNSMAESVLPQNVRDVDIVENIGQNLPLDLTFKNHLGDEVKLEKYFNQKKPVILNLVYYQCPSLCSFVLNGFTKGLNQMKKTPGKDFNIVTISINPSETPHLAKEKRSNYISTLKNPLSDQGWDFLTGDQQNINMLTEAMGFKYKTLENGEYSHAAAIFIASERGKLSRYLYGVEFSGFEIRRGLLDAMEGKSISTMDKVLIFCFPYSEQTGGYVWFAINFMTGTGYVIVAIMALIFGGFWVGEVKRKRRKADSQNAAV